MFFHWGQQFGLFLLVNTIGVEVNGAGGGGASGGLGASVSGTITELGRVTNVGGQGGNTNGGFPMAVVMGPAHHHSDNSYGGGGASI